MKKLFLASVASIALAGAAVADTSNFKDVEGTVSATSGMFTFELEGTARTGASVATISAEVFAYNFGNGVDSTVDVFGRYHRNYSVTNEEDFGAGAVYNLVYEANDLALYGSVELEYLTRSNDALVTPMLGSQYRFAHDLTAFAEVSHTWVGNDSWARRDGLAEVGLRVDLADNITFTPSIRHRFEIGGSSVTQAHFGLDFRF